MSNVLETIDGGTRYLQKRGVEEARRTMQMLVAHQLGCTRMQLYTRFDEPIPEHSLVPLREMLKKRGEGIPVQHLIGTVFFHKNEFKTDARALIPRPETEELTEWILEWNLPEGASILDMGCGSGVIGLSLATARPACQITLADVSSDALALARENGDNLQLPNTTFIESHLFTNITELYHGIVANLPYIPDHERSTLTREVMHDPELALFSGTDGLDLIRNFIPQAYQHLHPGGWLVLEIGHDQAAQVSEILKSSGFTDIIVKSDLSRIPRFPFARRP